MYHFHAMLTRMKYIARWGLMRNTRTETLSEHCLETAVIAHTLVMIKNKRFGGNLNPERAMTLALFHDASEIITGDLPTPIKYYGTEIKDAYDKIEENAINKLCSMLPPDLSEEYENILKMNGENDALYISIVKAADKISALIKCIEEKNCGNNEFKSAEISTLEKIKSLNMEEVNVFLEEILPSFYLDLDEMK